MDSPNIGEMKAKKYVQGWAQVLKDENLGVRRSAALALRKIRDPRAIHTLKDRDEFVRQTAEEALEEIRSNKSQK